MSRMNSSSDLQTLYTQSPILCRIEWGFVYAGFSRLPPEISVSEPTLTFKCLGHTKRDDGLIGRCEPETTDTTDSETDEFSVETKHLLQHKA